MGVLIGSIFGWMAWLKWRALTTHWGSLHARQDGSDVIMENPFHLVFGKKKRFPIGDTVKLSVTNRMRMGRAQSEWKVAGTRSTVVFYAVGPWTDAMWYDLGAGLQRLGFTIVAYTVPVEQALTQGG